MENPIYFRWLGVAGIELTINQKVLLIDPYLTRIPFRKVLFGGIRSKEELIQKHITRCHHILITHSHFDHLMDVSSIAGRTGAAVFGSPNTCRLLFACGLSSRQLHEVDAGNLLDLNPFRVRVLPANILRFRDFRIGHCAPDSNRPCPLWIFAWIKPSTFKLK